MTLRTADIGPPTGDFYFDLYNEIAEKYPESQTVYSEPLGRWRDAHIREAVAGWTGLTLDVGCNDGHYSDSFSRGYVGLDIARACLLKFRLERAQGLAQTLPFKDASFDNVLLSETLEHIPTPLAVLQEARRVLKDGGNLLVSTPFGPNADYHVWFPILGQHGVRKREYLHAEFTPERMKDLLVQAGFHDVETEVWRNQLFAKTKRPKP